jgi:hypothetical protein
MNTALLLGALLLQSTSGLTDEEEKAHFARGQKYLDKVAAVWCARLPQERLLGIYMGRTWIGSLRLIIRAAPEGSGGAFEFKSKQELQFAGLVVQTDVRAILDAKLGPLSAERTETIEGRSKKSKVTVANGKWIASDDGQPDREGTPGPGQTLEANFLPLFARPDEAGLLIICPIGDKGINTYERLPDKVERTFDGKKQACSVLKVGHLDHNKPDLWYFSEDGRPLEMRLEVEEGSWSPRYRPIAEAALGKTLTEPLEVKPAERRVLDMFVAIRKNDATAVAACFDFDRYAKESFPNFATATPADQKKAVATVRQAVLQNLMVDEKTRASQPEPAALEDVLSLMMKTTEESGITSIVVKGSNTWKLHQPAEGPRKGQWLIFKYSQ